MKDCKRFLSLIALLISLALLVNPTNAYLAPDENAGKVVVQNDETNKKKLPIPKSDFSNK